MIVPEPVRTWKLPEARVGLHLSVRRPQEPGTAGGLLTRARMRARLTQAEMAGRIGITQQTLSKLELGQYKPSMSVMERAAEALGYRFVFGFAPAGWSSVMPELPPLLPPPSDVVHEAIVTIERS